METYLKKLYNSFVRKEQCRKSQENKLGGWESWFNGQEFVWHAGDSEVGFDALAKKNIFLSWFACILLLLLLFYLRNFYRIHREKEIFFLHLVFYVREEERMDEAVEEKNSWEGNDFSNGETIS